MNCISELHLFSIIAEESTKKAVKEPDSQKG